MHKPVLVSIVCNQHQFAKRSDMDDGNKGQPNSSLPMLAEHASVNLNAASCELVQSSYTAFTV